MAEAKPAMKMSFGFAKKAEPKKYVAALSTKKEDNREEIKGLNEDGQVVLEKPKEGQGPPVIKCKNPLDQKRVAAATSGQKPKMLGGPVEDVPGGIVNKNIDKLSTEDAEAMRELLKDATREEGDEPAVAPVPILMKEGSKRIREASGNAPEATREQFENVPVESFGEAMLRGMGYDPGLHQTKPIFRDKLRDNCLGLGAKALLPGEKMQISGKKGLKAPPKAASGVAKASGIAAAAVEAEEPEPEKASAASSEPPEKKPRTDEADCEVVAASTGMWASRGLVVKVISKEGQLRDFFGAEAVVLEIDEAQSCCRIKARPNGGDKSQQLKGVRIQDIETRVSRDCQKVRIVRGPQKGTVAKLLKRDSTRGKAVLSIEGAETELSLDDVCQFMGE